ncbi:MAG TPA: acetyltransferase [Chitinophagaceae bacterium]|nr:acetyltransferase [Chitinophagaceae bacterium]
MQPKIILGYSENVLSLIFESFLANGERGPFLVLQNVPAEPAAEVAFSPEGVHVEVRRFAAGEHLNPNAAFLFGVASARIKQKIFRFFRSEAAIDATRYTNLLHPSAAVASSAVLDSACYLEPYSVVSPFARLGFGVTINRGVTIGHHVSVGDFATLGPGVHVAGHSEIGELSELGIGTVVFDHVRIGRNCKIGGGSVVTRDIPDDAVAWGNPCEIKRYNVTHDFSE